MAGNRRDFIKAGVAASVLGGSSASAKTLRRKTGSGPRTGPKIAIITSTVLGAGHFNQAFLAGLNRDYNGPIQRAGDREKLGDYDALKQAMKDAIAETPAPDLIVAAGGLIAGIAAAAALMGNKSIPFIFATGRLPQLDDQPANTDRDNFIKSANRAGGVDLFTVGQNEQRYQALATDRSVTPDNVALIVNNKAAMVEQEVGEWVKTHNPNLVVRVVCDADTTKKQLGPYLKNKLKQAAAIVVSSDPCLRYFRTVFRNVMRTDENFQGRICYPFSEYQVGDAGQSIVIGPELAPASGDASNSVYYQLGLKAAAVLNARTSGTVLLPNVKVAQWNGTMWPDIQY